MVPQFRYRLLKAIDESPPDMKEYKDRQIDDNVLRQFQRLFGHQLTDGMEIHNKEVPWTFKLYLNNSLESEQTLSRLIDF